jgi:protein-S-isoprenylcysteine O-methyltransferase Ste14
MYIWCAGEFISRGHGTPAPYDAPKLLVKRGLYRYTRNPMYLGITTALLGEALLFRSLAILIYAGAVFIGFHLRAVLYEEPVLRKNFDGQFEEYCRRVPRWFLLR